MSFWNSWENNVESALQKYNEGGKILIGLLL